MRKKIISGLLIGMGILYFAQPVMADQFAIGSNYDNYQGGYITKTEKHFTQYQVRGNNITVGAGIRIKREPVQVVSNPGKARVESSGRLNPYIEHVHSKYVY